MKYIENEWDKYLYIVIPADASQQQKDECKLVFFAGALSLMQLLLKKVDGDEDVAAMQMEEIHDELQKFAIEFAITGKVPK